MDVLKPNPTGQKYQVIMMDPAWRNKSYTEERSGTPRRIKGDHYETMTLEEMKQIPLDTWMDKDCAVFMWVIDSHLEQAFELAKHFGLRYSSVAFFWKKLTVHGKNWFGMGKTTRKGVEQCLLFFKGSVKRQDAGVRQLIEAPEPEWIDAKVREHSRKPDEQYELIERLYPGPYAELFSKTTAPGWAVAGKQSGTYKIGEIDGRAYERAKGRTEKKGGIESVLKSKKAATKKPTKRKVDLDDFF